MTEERKNTIKKEIEKAFNYSTDITEIAKNIVDRMEEESLTEFQTAFDDELIWTQDQWTIIQYYITPKELGTVEYYEIEQMFCDDILKCLEV